VLRGDVANNPAEQSYFIIQMWDSTGTTATCQFDFIVEYDSWFTEPRQLTESLKGDVGRMLMREIRAASEKQTQNPAEMPSIGQYPRIESVKPLVHPHETDDDEADTNFTIHLESKDQEKENPPITESKDGVRVWGTEEFVSVPSRWPGDPDPLDETPKSRLCADFNKLPRSRRDSLSVLDMLSQRLALLELEHVHRSRLEAL